MKNIIPDYVEPFIAHRTWKWSANGVNPTWHITPSGVNRGLYSLNNTYWHPRVPMVANTKACMHCVGVGIAMEMREPELGHQAPGENCSCGIYAAKDFEHLKKHGYWDAIGDDRVHGDIYLWGKICEHELGYRAQFAYPKNLTFRLKELPWSMREVEQEITTLTEYGVDVYFQPSKKEKRMLGPSIADPEGLIQTKIEVLEDSAPSVLVYSPESGYNHAAIAQIVDRAQQAQTISKPSLDVGERVSVKNKGLGVIKSTIGDLVTITMTHNKEHWVIPMRSLHFEHRNNRWEADPDSIWVSGREL